jgi:hypothetical protein
MNQNYCYTCIIPEVESTGVVGWRDVREKSFYWMSLSGIQNIICYSCANKNVDIKFNAHDALLNYPSSCTLKVDRFESKYTEYT